MLSPREDSPAAELANRPADPLPFVAVRLRLRFVAKKQHARGWPGDVFGCCKRPGLSPKKGFKPIGDANVF
jgi:hypothetical protein